MPLILSLLLAVQVMSSRSEAMACSALPSAMAMKVGVMNFSCATSNFQTDVGWPRTPLIVIVTGTIGA